MEQENAEREREREREPLVDNYKHNAGNIDAPLVALERDYNSSAMVRNTSHNCYYNH
jgi:hypothetical protein